MGLRGPQRDPNSVRGKREARKLAHLSVIDGGAASEPGIEDGHGMPVCPKWLSIQARTIYNGLVADLTAAKVPIKAIDAHAISMAATCLEAIQEAEDMYRDLKGVSSLRVEAMKLKARYQRDLQSWLNLICATPGARARLGMKPAPERKGGKLAELLAARMARSN